MADETGGDGLLAQARERETSFDWLGAAEAYEDAMRLVPEDDFAGTGEIQERLAHALYRAARQADNVEGFKERMDQAAAKYGEAKESYGKVGGPRAAPRSSRCGAMVAHIASWTATDPREKERLHEESRRFAVEAFAGFEGTGEGGEYVRTFNLLSYSRFPVSAFMGWDPVVRLERWREVVERGHRAISFLPAAEDPSELARAFVAAGSFVDALNVFYPGWDAEGASRKGLEYWTKAIGLSEAAAYLELNLGGGFWGDGTEEALAHLEKALERARLSRDSYYLGYGSAMMTYQLCWRMEEFEDPEIQAGLLDRALDRAKEAHQHLSRVLAISSQIFHLWAEAPEADYFLKRADLESDIGKKRELLGRALEAVPEALKCAETFGNPEAISSEHIYFAAILAALAKIEPDPGKREKLLSVAFVHSAESVRIMDLVEPFMYYNRGHAQRRLALIRSELADLAGQPDEKVRLLKEAVKHMETAVEFFHRTLPVVAATGDISSIVDVAKAQSQHGELLNRLYALTGEVEALQKALEAFEAALEGFRKANLSARIAECHWNSARILDLLGEHPRAAERFHRGAEQYRLAAKKTKQLEGLYKEHAAYMEAWGAIEHAKSHHAQEAFGKARESYEKAAELHQSAGRWRIFAPNYQAWARIESAEELSRAERGEESIRAFTEAIQLFEESRQHLDKELAAIEEPGERRMANDLIRATGTRQEYCKARIMLEEAKLLERRGEHAPSAEKYGKAAEAFEQLAKALGSKSDRREAELIMTLAKAWQQMARAEAEASSAHYTEASQFFEAAKELAPSEAMRTLTLGHSRFCLALEAGMKFADSAEPALHAAAVQHLESAAKYYLKAGFKNASEYAKASKLLFDAYAHMDKASREDDLSKKAKLYTMAERVLEAAVSSYAKADHPAKEAQVQRLLEKAKDEKALALSLIEVLEAPSVVSSTTGFSTPTPTYEKAVGLERFEHADIQTTIIARKKDLRVDEDLNLEIELVNAGRGPAQLIRLDKVIPEGFELKEKPEVYRVEDSYLNLKGRRLDPLKSEEVKIVLKPKVQGRFKLEPRILYLDDEGKYKSHEPEPITITVKELGISGWLKGPKKAP